MIADKPGQSLIGRCLTGVNTLVASTPATAVVVRIVTHSFSKIAFVNVKVSFTPRQFSVALKRQDMRRKPIEEPAVVTGHHDTPGKVHDGFFQSP